MTLNPDFMPKELKERIINANVNTPYFIHIPYDEGDDIIINKVIVRCEIKLINRIQFLYGFKLVNGEWQLKAIYVGIYSNIIGRHARGYYRKSLDDNDFERIVKVVNGMKRNKNVELFLRRRCFERTSVFYPSIAFDLY